MTRKPKNSKWYEEQMERNRQFRALLEKRKALDEKLAAEKAARAQQ